MCKKLLFLTAFVSVLGLVGSASAMLNYEYYEAPAGTQYQAMANVGFGTTTPTRAGTSDTLNATDGDWTLQAGGSRADDFAFRFLGYVVVPVSGEITFYLRSDDGSQLRIDGTMVVDDDGLHGAEAFPGKSGKVTLTAGAHAIEATMFERGGDDSLFVNWSYAGQAATGVPDRLLFLQAPADVTPYVVREALNPNPASGVTEVDIASLEWNAGYGAVSHKVYLSKDETIDATDLIAETPITIQVAAPEPGVTYYWRVDEVAADGTVVQGPVWTFATLPREAHFPSPPDGATNLSRATLSWTAGKGAILQNVYLGTDPAALLPKSMMQLPTSYDPGALAAGTTYYWRIDEFTPGGTVKGPVWSFSTIGAVTPSGTPDLILEYLFEEGPSSFSALDTSGNNHHGALLGNAKIDGALILDGNGDCVDAGSSPDYHPAGAFSVSAFINMTSWGGSWSNVIVGTRGENNLGWQLRRNSGNQNLTFTIRGTPGADDPRGTIVPPLNEWIHVAGVFDPVGGTRTVYINGIQDVQITDSGKVATTDHKLYVGARAKSDKSGPEAFFNGSINDLRIHSRALTLHEVRVMAGVEALPYTPDPANGGTGVSTPVALKWNPGDYAVSQDVYFGTAADAVAAANATDTTGIYRGRQAETTYSAGDLAWGVSYYWRVDQVAADASIVAGPVWSFTTADRVVIENFESYDVVPTAPDPAGLVGWWQFDEGTGTVATDSSGSGNNGTLDGGPTVVDGQSGKALSFANSRVTIPPSASLTGDLFKGSFTLAAWINPTRTGNTWQQVFRAMKADGTTSSDTLFLNSDGRLSWRGRVGGTWTTLCETATNVVPANQWTHVAVTGNGTNFRIYVAQALSQQSAFRATDGTNGTYYIGGNPGTAGESYTGMIDNVRIYSRALSEAEVAAAAGFVATNPIGNTWVGSGTAIAVLTYDAPLDKAMSIQYQNGTAPFIGEVSAVPAITDMTKGAGNLLIWVRGDPANVADPIYVALDDSAGASAVVTNPDQLAAQDGNWTAWIIPLDKFAGVNLASVAKLAIGVGNGQPGGAGAIRIDDITLVRSVVIAEPADVTTPGDFVRGVPNDGDWPGGEYPALAIDNNRNTKFLHYKGDIGPSGIQVTPLANQTIVTGLTFTSANDTAGRDPVTFELSGSNVGVNGPYELIAAGRIVDFNQPTEWLRFTKNTTPISFDNAVAYDHYQLIFTAIRDAPNVNSMQIAEVELIGISASAVKPKIIWVSDNKTPAAGVPADQAWVDLLSAQGYDVDLSFRNKEGRTLDDAKIAALNAADLIIISRDTNSGDYASNATEVTQWNSVTTPVLMQVAQIAQNSRWRWLNSATTNSAQPVLQAVATTHPIFNGVTLDASNQVGVLTTNVSFVSTADVGNGTLIASRADNGQVWIVEWQAGLAFYASSTETPAGHRMLFCSGGTTGVSDGTYDLTAEGEKMFLNAVAYMVK